MLTACNTVDEYTRGSSPYIVHIFLWYIFTASLVYTPGTWYLLITPGKVDGLHPHKYQTADTDGWCCDCELVVMCENLNNNERQPISMDDAYNKLALAAAMLATGGAT